MGLRLPSRTVLMSGGEEPVAGPWYLSVGIPTGNVYAVYQPKGAASLAASYININNPGTNNAIDTTTPGWNSTDGWIFNGSTSVLTAGSVGLSANQSVIIRYSNVTNEGYLFGVNESASARLALCPNLTSTHVRYLGPVFEDIAPPHLGGVLALANYGYRDGVLNTGNITATNAAPSRTHPIGARRVSGTIQDFCACKIQAIAIYSVLITSGQVAAITAAMNAL